MVKDGRIDRKADEKFYYVLLRELFVAVFSRKSYSLSKKNYFLAVFFDISLTILVLRGRFRGFQP